MVEFKGVLFVRRHETLWLIIMLVAAVSFSAMSFGAMQALGHNGALVWTSITGGQRRDDPTQQHRFVHDQGTELMAQRARVEVPGRRRVIIGLRTSPSLLRTISIGSTR